MGNINASENIKKEFKKIVFQKHGKLHGALRKEVDEALIQHGKTLLKRLEKTEPMEGDR